MMDELNPRQPEDTPESAKTLNPASVSEATDDAASDALDALLADAPDDAAPHFLDDPLATGEMDIDAALAAVAALQDIASTEDEPVEAHQDWVEVPAVMPAVDEPRIEPTLDDDDDEPFYPAQALTGDDGEAILDAPVALPVSASNFARPPLMTIQRGQAASVVPAIVLMALGAWLTYALVSGAGVPAAQLPGLGMGAAGLMLLAQWLSSERWARGSFFMGALLLLGGMLLLYLLQPGSLGSAGYPLLLGAVGLALLLTGIFTSPRSGRLFFVGLALTAGGGAVLLFTGGFLPSDLVTLLTSAAPLILIVALVIVLLPFLRRR
jgi:hypothetical protein